MGNAGRVLMIPKGEYNSATTYEMLDFVYYQGRSYVCKQTSTGNVPTNTTYWQALTGDASAEIQALTNYVTENNVKNFLPTPYYSGTYSEGGVTYTPNADGTITVSGTASAANINYFFIRYNVASPLKKGTYIFSVEGLGNGDSANNLRVLFGGGDSGLTSRYLVRDSDSVTFEITEDYKTVGYCLVQTKDAGAISATLKPMIRDASITDTTYQPYAKTNVELTADVVNVPTLNKVIKRFKIAGNSGTANIPKSDISNSAYCVFIVIGFIRGVGAVILCISVNESAITSVLNLKNGEAFTNETISFTYDSNGLTITNNEPSASSTHDLTVIVS